MKVKEFNLSITEEMENNLANKYNNYMERKEEFEKQTGLKVIKAIDNYNYCIIKNGDGRFILGKVYNNCISIGGGFIKEFENFIDISQLENYPEKLNQLADLSNM